MISCRDRECGAHYCETCPAIGESIFQGLDSSLSEKVEREKSVRKVRKRQQLVVEGDAAQALVCIRSGWMKLTQRDTRGRESVVRIVGPGETLGYVEVVTGGKFRLSARAVTDGEVCLIGRGAFEAALSGPSQVARRLLNKACQALIDSEHLALSRASMSVRERVALTLHDIARRFGVEAPDGGVAITLPLSRQDIAGLAGTVLESAVRQLSDLKDEGVIELKGRSIVIRKMDALAAIFGAQKH